MSSQTKMRNKKITKSKNLKDSNLARLRKFAILQKARFFNFLTLY